MISVPVGLVILVVVLALVEIPAWRRFNNQANEIKLLKDEMRLLRAAEADITSED